MILFYKNFLKMFEKETVEPFVGVVGDGGRICGIRHLIFKSKVISIEKWKHM